MSVEISFGGTCRDISLLPQSPNELRSFFMDKLVPAIWEDFSKNIAMTQGNTDRGIVFEAKERGCEVGGSVTIRL